MAKPYTFEASVEYYAPSGEDTIAGDNSTGTRMYCPECKELKKMRVVNPWKADSDSYSYEGQYSKFPHGDGSFEAAPDVRVYHRVRECGSCELTHNYWEIDDEQMSEFLRLKKLSKALEQTLARAPLVALYLSDFAEDIETVCESQKT